MAIKIPFQRAHRPALQRRSGSAVLSSSPSSDTTLAASTSSSNNTLSLSDVQDLIYMTNVTIGGVSFPVQIDTGSSDLWVLPTEGLLPDAETSSTTLNLTYDIGWAYGQVAYALTDFAGITVPKQAYLNVSSSHNPAFSYGAAGIMGLGFDSLSNIDLAINHTGYSSGRTLLYNLFHDNLSEPNFIALSLESTSDNDGVQGTFSVGEVDPQYANVTSTNKIPTWPVNFPLRWNVLLDSFIVGTQTSAVSTTIAAAPQNKAVICLDTGTSYTYAPTEVCTAIYGGVSGARYDSSLGQWIIPCDAEIDMALQIDNQIFPIHPLDITPTSPGDSSTCVGSFIPQNVSVIPGQLDWLIGANVLRSIYTLYDYGDFNSSGDTGNPYIQMLALIDPNEASVEFHNVRGGTPNSNITYKLSNDGSGSTTVSLSTDVTTALENLSKLLPTILGIMALNCLALVALVIVGTIFLCRRRGKNARVRKIPGRSTPMPMEDLSGFRDSQPPEAVPHAYQPVSVALTEDTLFAPPFPGFKNDASRFGSRPNSIA